jgi:hypothetical protein
MKARRADSLNAKKRLYELHDEHGTSWSRAKYAKQLFDEDLVEKEPDAASTGKMLKLQNRKEVESKLLHQNNKRDNLKRQRRSPVEHLNITEQYRKGYLIQLRSFTAPIQPLGVDPVSPSCPFST